MITLSQATEDLIKEEVKEEKMEIAIKMLEKGKLSEEELVEFFGVTLEEIEKLKEHTI